MAIALQSTRLGRILTEIRARIGRALRRPPIQDPDMSPSPTSGAFDRTERTGSPALVLLFAVLFVAAAASSSFLPPDQASRLTIGLLALLAIIGVVALFAFAVGFLQFSGQAARDDITKI